MGLLDFITDGVARGKQIDPKWVKNNQGNYHRLVFLEPDKYHLEGKGGVFVAWHSGVRPEWVYAAKSHNLATDLDHILDNKEIMEYDTHGGLFVTWAYIQPDYRDNILKYLLDKMDPLVANRRPPKKKVKPQPVILPSDRGQKI